MSGDAEIAALEAWLGERTGLAFSPNRAADSRAAVRRALGRSGAASVAEYRALLARDDAALDDLLAELTVGETYFFRDPRQIGMIREEILPALRARSTGPLRAWSAGCATGEEAYTLAIVLREAGLGEATHLLATDLSRARLAAARRGRYRRWALRGMPEPAVRRYFTRHDESFELHPSLRAAVEFRYLNLVANRYPSLSSGVWGMDLILCRNVLIYLDRAAVERVVRRLMDTLAVGGWLVLGASDPLIADLVPCEVIVTRAGLAYRRPSGGGAPRPAPVRAHAAPEPAAAPPRLPAAAPGAATPGPRAPAVAEPPRPEVEPEPRQIAAAYAARRYPEVVRLAREWLARRDGPEVRALQVRALANQGLLAEAGQACSAALDRFRDSAELLYLHALLLLEGGRAADAAAAARRALYADRSLVVAHLLLASALARAGRRAAAARSLHNAARLLAPLPADAPVPAADGEPAGRLLRIARAELQLLEEAG